MTARLRLDPIVFIVDGPSTSQILSIVLALALPAAVTVGGCETETIKQGQVGEVLASVPTPFGLAVDSTEVYVAGAGTWIPTTGTSQPAPLLAVPIGGGTPSVLASQSYGMAIAVDESRIYWSDGTSIFECSKPDCLISTTTLAPYGAGQLAVDADSVYWATSGIGSSPNGASIMKVDKNGGSAIQVSTATTPVALAVDANNVYWLDDGPWPGNGGSTGGVIRAPNSGGAPLQLTPNNDPSSLMGISIDANNVYFLTGDGKLWTVPKTGGPTRLLFGDLGNEPEGIATDGKSVYVAVLYLGGATALVKVPLDGGSPVSLTSDLVGPNGIAVDDTSVYVADWIGNAIVKLVK